MGIFNIFKHAQEVFEKTAQSKQELQLAEKLAQKKQFRQAVKIGEEILSIWSNSHSFVEQLTRQIALGDFLDIVNNRLQIWQQVLTQADQLAATAKYILQADTGNPLDTQAYSEALSLFKQCVNLVDDANFLQAVSLCEREIIQRKNFQELINLAKIQTKNLFFRQALNIYNDASKLYTTADLKSAIHSCSSQLEKEEIYTNALREAQQAATQGRLRVAIGIIELALTKFNRSDGIKLLEKLQRTLKGKQNYRAGLIAEKQGDINTAIDKYKQAALLLPEPTECLIRQAILAVRNNDSSQVINLLQYIHTSQANYIRGFAYFQQGNLQQAKIEWQSLTESEIKEQQQILKVLSERKRLTVMREIEESVDADKLQLAKELSLSFIQQFSVNEIVKTNLAEHIQPRLDLEAWQSQDWEVISKNAEKIWQENYNITALHNWSIATYYYAQIDNNQIEKLIIAWSTALANININPILKNIPWVTNQSIDLENIYSDLQKLIAELIEKVKEKNINQYFHLRDVYRREIATLQVIKNNPNHGVKFKNLFLLPGCYFLCRHQLPVINFPAQIWGALYTDWGLAVAACLEGDLARAIQIQPQFVGKSSSEQFAREFVSYHEGCYYLQQKQWTKAINSLQVAKSEIKTSPDWYAEIDKLCAIQRQAIDDFSEHLDFAQFWYNLLASQGAKSYLAEYKAEEIRDKLVNEKISEAKAIKELQELKKIDTENPIVIDLIERLEFTQEMLAIQELLKRNKWEEAVKKAKKSSNQKVRYKLADVYLEILIEGFQKRQLGFAEICELGNWVHELAPEHPEVQEVYKFTKELEGIYNLMKRDRFDDAVLLAKISQNELVRFYVAEFFILALVKGLEKRNLPINIIHQFGKWAYELCPNEPAFQEIYRTMKLRW